MPTRFSGRTRAGWSAEHAWPAAGRCSHGVCYYLGDGIAAVSVRKRSSSLVGCVIVVLRVLLHTTRPATALFLLRAGFKPLLQSLVILHSFPGGTSACERGDQLSESMALQIEFKAHTRA